MKSKIKPFIKRLIRDNIIYILGNVFLLVLIVMTIKKGLTEVGNYKIKIDTLKTENTQLSNKLNLMNTIIPGSDVLDGDINFLNTLIPNVEDYFSIIYSLDKLSKKTNFIINDYTVNVAASTSEKLRISVSGVGDSQSLINFLTDYNFYGGRLITSDKVEIDPNFSGTIKIDLTFYNKKTESGNVLEVSPNGKIYKELENLMTRVNFSFDKAIEESPPVLDYPKKNNPF